MIAEPIEANDQSVTLARLIPTDEGNQARSSSRTEPWTLTARDLEAQVLHRLKDKGFDWSETLRGSLPDDRDGKFVI
jgi:hypothetical protein